MKSQSGMDIFRFCERGNERITAVDKIQYLNQGSRFDLQMIPPHQAFALAVARGEVVILEINKVEISPV